MSSMEKRTVNILELPESQRPYERFYHLGGESLSDQELLAIIIGSGSRGMNALETAQEILSSFARGEGIPELADTSIEELMEVPGVGMSKAVRIKAALEMGRRCQNKRLKQSVDCTSPSLIAAYFRPQMEHLPNEELRAVFLDCKNKLIREMVVSKGGLSSAVIHPRDLFREAVKANASALVLVHNHPSGDPSPSPEDLKTTRRFVEAGHMLGIRLHDHIIIGKDRFISLFASEKYASLFAL